jgi:hypothetical protein
MEIRIKAIPHNQQRYNTVGDWYFSKRGCLEIRVSQMDFWRAEVLVCVHELVEALLCIVDGISPEAVDDFDTKFESPSYSIETPSMEPGDHPKAPYQFQHCIATAVERLLCPLLGLKWGDYDRAVTKVAETWEGKKKNG